MPRTKISEFSSTPANNTDIDSINISEGCAPSGINDAIRELMSQLKDWQSGTSNDPMVIGSSGSLTLNQGTANGVTYLNGSKVVTSGSALTFDGTNFGIGAATALKPLDISFAGTSGARRFLASYDDSVITIKGANASNDPEAIRITGDNIRFNTGTSGSGSEQMRLTSTGLGIGTSSPSQKLDVRGNMYMAATNARIYIDNGGVGGSSIQLGASGTSHGYVGTDGNFPLVFQPNNTERMRLDTSGNLGLGVTPSAWAWPNGSAGALQLQSGAAVSGYNATTYLSQNWYYNAGEKYIANGFATRYEQTTGKHAWYTAASGTAGNAVSWTQAMTLDASGNLGLGTTSPASRLSVDAARSDTAGTGWLTYTNVSTTSGKRAMRVDTSNGHWFDYYNGSSWSAQVGIDSSGNLLVGATTTSGITSGSSDNAHAFISFEGNVNAQRNNGACVYLSKASGYTSGTMVAFSVTGTERGSITTSGTTVTYNTTSDYRLKNVIGAVSGSGERIDALEPIEYEWKSDGSLTRGFLAHKFQEVYADSVTGTKDAVDEEGNPVYQAMQASSSEVIADLVAEIQSLRKRLANAGL